MKSYLPFLNFYMVWHPDFQTDSGCGLSIAKKIYQEFSRDPEKPMSPALGIPIYFRSSSKEETAPPPIPLERAKHNVVALLADSSMVIDPAYQTYVQELATRLRPEQDTILSFAWPKSGFLDLGKIQQIALKGEGPALETELRMKLAAESCRLLQNRPWSVTGSEKLSPEPPILFISHAKRDAEDKAEELKMLVENTPVDTFFDRVSIAAGFDFTDEIRENIKRSAVLAWQSDEYGSRPWCNIEVLTAKEALRPIVVVLGLKAGEERSFPYLGNVRTIVGTGTNSPEIIIAALREYLRKLYMEGRFEALAQAEMVPRTRFFLFRPPEPIDGALIEHKSRDNTGNGGPPSRNPEPVLYPDPPISTIESDVLSRLFPEIRFMTPTTVDPGSLSGLKVALSISEPEDVADFGQSLLHVRSLMLELARHILSRGGVVAYGGDLRLTRDGGFTRELFQLVYAYKDLHRLPVERIWNFLAHHVASEIPKQDEAELLQLARFEKPLPGNLARRFQLGPRQPVPDDNAEHRYVRARCLTAMRQDMLEKTDARIVVGGRISGHQGKYPGILEEASLVLGRKPLYVIGAFGGSAYSIVRALRDKQSPEVFDRGYHVVHPRTAKWRSLDGAENQQEVPFKELERSYQAYSQDSEIGQEPINYPRLLESFQKASIADLRNGLTTEESLELFETPDLDLIVLLVIKGLLSIGRSGESEPQHQRS